MDKIALLVGVDHYKNDPLQGCVRDARNLHAVLKTHDDGAPNFQCRSKLSTRGAVTRVAIKRAATELFAKPADIALFFFAGHGTVNNLGGYLVTQDASQYDEGFAMGDLLRLANHSRARERIIILDCCHSGVFGNLPGVNNEAHLSEGLSVLTACRDTETATEIGEEGGLFSNLVIDALRGGAADAAGKVSIAGIYAYADEVLGGWDQRPLFKSHVSKLGCIRDCTPSVPLEILRKLTVYFPSRDATVRLGPAYEPTLEPHDEEKEALFGDLQRLRAARLAEPVGEEHMFYAAKKSKTCRLTALGRFYWSRIKNNKL